MGFPKLERRAPRYRRKNPADTYGFELESILIAKVAAKAQKEVSEMAVLRVRRRRKRKSAMSKGHPTERREAPETEFKGPNVNKRHRKPDEIYGDTSIPDSARKE